jgi:CRISPR-associated endonuclease/helicase Cas3
MTTITLAPQYEKLSPLNPFSEAMPMLLYHQYRTYTALQSQDLVINAYNTGTGKTKASLLHLHDLPATNVLFIAPTNELIRQHVNDINTFVNAHKLDFRVLEVNAAVLRRLGIDSQTFGNGERLRRLIRNPLEFAEQLHLDAASDGRTPNIMVVNPDIFYYGLYFSYASKDRRNVFQEFLTSFDYIVIDEFHYYNIKQLANFLFFFVICEQFGYFDGTRKVCLLSATPNENVLEFLHRSGLRYALITPDNEPPESQAYATVQSLAEVRLSVSNLESLEKLVDQQQTVIRKYILEDDMDGAIISSALWKINQINNLLTGLPKGRITGAEGRESRRAAQYQPLILATPTVDIGYNFEKRHKARQNIDFLFFDGMYQDDFIQRVGRVSRTLGKTVLDVPGLAWATTDQSVAQELGQRGQQCYDRPEFTALLKEKLPPKNDLQRYIRSYAITEAFYPIYQLEKIMPADLQEKLSQLFERVKSVFAPSSKRTYGGIRHCIKEYEEQRRLVFDGDTKTLRKYLGRFVSEKTGDSPSQADLETLYAMMQQRKELKQEVVDFVRAKFELTHALFNFRDAFEGPTAGVFDPEHLLSEQDVTTYDLFHLISHFQCQLYPKKQFEALTRQSAPKADFYLKIQNFLPARQFVGLYYETDQSQEQFEREYCNEPRALTNLKVTLNMAGNTPIGVDPQVYAAIQDRFIPCLIVKSEDRGRLFALLRKRNLFSRTLVVQSANAETEYPIVLGTAALFVHAELYGYFVMKQQKQHDCWIV